MTNDEIYKQDTDDRTADIITDMTTQFERFSEEELKALNTTLDWYVDRLRQQLVSDDDQRMIRSFYRT